MDKITLEVTEGVYQTAKEARAAGRVPMVCYGKGTSNHSFSVGYQEFRRAYKKGGRSTIMYFQNEKNEEFPVIVHDIQYDPVTDQMVHVDVMAVDLNKPIKTQIPIILKGIAPAVKDLNGILVQNRNTVEVECLPKDLVREIEVDVSPIVDFHTSITVGGIIAPNGIKILDAKDINVVTVSAPRTLEEEDAAVQKAKEAATLAAETTATEGTTEEGAKKEEEKKSE